MAVSNQFRASLLIILFVVLFGFIFLAFAGLSMRVASLEKAQMKSVAPVTVLVTVTPSPTATPAAVLRPVQRIVQPTK